MAFILIQRIQRTTNGWTDYFGQHSQSVNRWDTLEQAQTAVSELAHLWGADPDSFRIIDVTDLESYNLLG